MSKAFEPTRRSREQPKRTNTRATRSSLYRRIVRTNTNGNRVEIVRELLRRSKITVLVIAIEIFDYFISNSYKKTGGFDEDVSG